MAKIIFLFKSTKNRYQYINTKNFEYLFYGFNSFKNKNFNKEHNISKLSSPALMGLINKFLNFIFSSYKNKMGVLNYYDTILGILKIRSRNDILFSTVDSIGLLLLILKKNGIIKNRIVYSSIGLLDRINMSNINFSCADHIICYTNNEREKLISNFDIKPEKITSITFPAPEIRHNDNNTRDIDVISIGNDLNRNFSTIIKLAEINPSLKFLIITSDTIKFKFLLNSPPNCVILTDISPNLIDYYISRSKIGVISINENSYSYGNITAMNFCAHGLPVLINYISLFDNEDTSLMPFILIKKNSPNDFSLEILNLLNSPDLFNFNKNKSIAYAIKNNWSTFNNTFNNILSSL